MNKKIVEKSIEIGGRELKIETGRLAMRANASVMARYGDTEVLATVVAADPQELDYFPLSVEYKEKYYAGGRISPSRFVKRERRPSDENVLVARLIDRSIRPLFPKDFKNEIQIIATVLSYDEENSPEVIAAIAASAALAISNIPWEGPISCVRVGVEVPEETAASEKGKFLLNPTNGQLEKSPLDLMVSSTAGAVVMVEAGAAQVPEEHFLEALQFAHEQNQTIIKVIKELALEVGQPKLAVVIPEIDPEVKKAVESYPIKKIDEIVSAAADLESSQGLNDLKEGVLASLGDNFSKSQVSDLVEKRFRSRVRELVLQGERPDKRAAGEVRPLDVSVSALPRTHGSAIFQRGNTQVLTVVTLGAPSLEQWIEGMMGEETKRYIHHFYAPPYCYGEVGRLGFPKRREIGHGALAERALVTVIPPEEKFPYTIRVVSEVMSSNGSTSMASVCGSTLALMDAGVPIHEPVAGIAMGLVTEKNKEVILTDIIGIEDFHGDMDFKVAGTKNGVTAAQLDVKVPGLSFAILETALKQARKARLEILEKMEAVISQPRSEISRFAPRISVTYIKPETIGEVIGPGGRTIREIIAKTGASIDVNDEGRVVISAATQDEVESARRWVEDLTLSVEPGDRFTGTVERIEPYGIFVKVSKNKEGLVHISEMSDQFVDNPSALVKIGDQVEVWVKGLNERGQISLTMISPSEGQEPSFKHQSKHPKVLSRPGGHRHESGPRRPGVRDYYREALDSKRGVS